MTTENPKTPARIDAEKWLALPEIELGYRAIGKLVVAAADCCMALKKQNVTDRDAVKLALAKTEKGKEQIACSVFSAIPLLEKQWQVEHCCNGIFSYFDDLLAQK